MIARLHRLSCKPRMRGGPLRRRALLRRLPGQPRLRAGHAQGRRRGAGADWLILCDTNGGTLPSELVEIIRAVQARGARAARHPRPQRRRVRGGQLAGRGARGRRPGAGDDQRLRRALRQRQPGLDHPQPRAQDGARLHPGAATCASCATSRASSPSWPTASRGRSQPYVGDSAFAHKGGMHVSAVLKHPDTYEHVDPGGGRQPPPRARLRAVRASPTSSGRRASTGSTSTTRRRTRAGSSTSSRPSRTRASSSRARRRRSSS